MENLREKSDDDKGLPSFIKAAIPGLIVGLGGFLGALGIFNIAKNVLEKIIKWVADQLLELFKSHNEDECDQLLQARFIADQNKYKQLVSMYPRNPQFTKTLQNIYNAVSHPPKSVKRKVKTDESIFRQVHDQQVLRELTAPFQQQNQNDLIMLNIIIQTDKQFYQQALEIAKENENKEFIGPLSEVANSLRPVVINQNQKGMNQATDANRKNAIEQGIGAVKNIADTFL